MAQQGQNVKKILRTERGSEIFYGNEGQQDIVQPLGDEIGLTNLAFLVDLTG